MHIVHMNAKYQTLAEAKGHPNGLAVLGFFFQVGLQEAPRNWVLVVQLSEHCMGVLREWEGAGRPSQSQERLGNPLTVQERAGWEPFPTALQQCEARLALPVVAWQDRMTQLCPAQGLPDFSRLFSLFTGL